MLAVFIVVFCRKFKLLFLCAWKCLHRLPEIPGKINVQTLFGDLTLNAIECSFSCATCQGDKEGWITSKGENILFCSLYWKQIDGMVVMQFSEMLRSGVCIPRFLCANRPHVCDLDPCCLRLGGRIAVWRLLGVPLSLYLYLFHYLCLSQKI